MACSWFRQNGVVASRPPAGNASRWAAALDKGKGHEYKRCRNENNQVKITVPMKIIYRFLWLLIFTALGLVSCTSPEERINAQFDALPHVNSALLYQYGAAASSATGDCGGEFQHRWYGTAMSDQDVTNFYSDYFSDNGWSVRPEEVVEIWSREDDDGLYRIGVSVFTDPADISQEQGSYRLPTSVILEAAHDQTVYLVGMFYMTPYAAEKCFGH